MKRLIRSLLRKAGYDIVPYRPGKEARVAQICAALGITEIFDVGANLGQFAKAMRAAGYAGHIRSFEPVPTIFTQLQTAFAGDTAWTGCDYALGAAPETREIILSDGPGAASSFMEFTDLSDSVVTVRQTEKVQARISTLDTVCAEAPPNGPALLKLDVQGYEMAALEGGKDSLDRFGLILLETSFFQIYAGEALMTDLFSHLTGRGYLPVAVFSEFEAPQGVTLQADLLFADAAAHRRLQDAMQDTAPT